jgi:hypothetical protein
MRGAASSGGWGEAGNMPQFMADMSLDDWAQVATIIGAVIAILVLGYTARQLKINTRISRGQFWLELRKMFAEHDEVHQNLRPGGPWHRSNTLPNTAQDMAKVEAYMGLFEHCEFMLREKLIDLKTFKHIYEYRLVNIVNNERIKEDKLKQRRQSWEAFIALLDRCNKLGLLT